MGSRAKRAIRDWAAFRYCPGTSPSARPFSRFCVLRVGSNANAFPVVQRRVMNMETKPQPDSPQEEQIRAALEAHWRASAARDATAEHAIYDDEVICDYPQSAERIFGRNNLQALRSHHPGKPSGFEVDRILGCGNLWITEYTIVYQNRQAYTVSIMEFCNGKVIHETQYFADPFEAPGWRKQWVQKIVRHTGEAAGVSSQAWPVDHEKRL